MHEPDGTIMPEVFFETSEAPKCSSPTLLYNLPTYGLGTADCESLRSYICRLADAHRISVYALLTHVLGEKLLSTGSRKWSPDMKILNNYLPIGAYTHNIRSVLADATSAKGLIFCTMAPLETVFARSRMFANVERHCPLCLIEDRQTGKLYGRLIWDIACINACPSHGTPLEESNCGASADYHVKKSFRKALSGVCRRCGSIGYQCRGKKPEVASEVDIWKARQVGEVIASFPEASQVFSTTTLNTGLRSLVDRFADGKAAIAARRAGIPKSVLWGWLKQNSTPTLGLLLNLCMVAEVSLLSVIKGEPVACESPCIEKASGLKRKKKPTTPEREAALKNALETIPPQSLSSVARDLDLDESVLRRKFPELSSLVTNRYRQFRADQKKQNHESMRQFGLKVIKELKAKDLPLTARNIRAESGHSYGAWTILYRVTTNILAEQENTSS